MTEKQSLSSESSLIRPLSPIDWEAVGNNSRADDKVRAYSIVICAIQVARYHNPGGGVRGSIPHPPPMATVYDDEVCTIYCYHIHVRVVISGAPYTLTIYCNSILYFGDY